MLFKNEIRNGVTGAMLFIALGAVQGCSDQGSMMEPVETRMQASGDDDAERCVYNTQTQTWNCPPGCVMLGGKVECIE